MIKVNNLKKSFGSVNILKGIDLEIPVNHGIIERNGRRMSGNKELGLIEHINRGISEKMKK